MTQLRWYHWYITDDNGVKHEHVKLQYRIKGKDGDYTQWFDVTHAWEDME